MTRSVIVLSGAYERGLAKRWIDKAPDGWTMDLREPKRSDDQNRALWSLLNQIQRQRSIHMGVKMTPDLWKAVFADALGSEMTILPKLDGDGYFPTHSTSQLGKDEFSNLLELMLAWCAREGLTIKHFDPEEKAA